MGLGLRLWKRARKYDRLLVRGDHQLLTTILIKALELKADAICFGFRPDIVGFREGGDDGGPCAEQLADLAKFFAEDPGGLRHAAVAQSTIFCPAEVPISMRINNVLQYFDGMHLRLLASILSAAQDRVVSLGASEESPQPMRYIEIGYGRYKDRTFRGPANQRRFVEVDIDYQRDNTIWIFVRAVREIEGDMPVCRSVYSVSLRV
jgi:hypothetical protein